MLDCLTNGDLSLTVSRRGAELVSLTRRGVGFLWRDGELTKPAKGWGNHATRHGIFLHRLKGERSFVPRASDRGRFAWFFAQQRLACPDRRRTKYATHLSNDARSIHGAGVSAQRLVRPDLRDRERSCARDISFQESRKGTSRACWLRSASGFRRDFVRIIPLRNAARSLSSIFFAEQFSFRETQEIDFAGGEMPFAREKLPGSYILEFVDVARAHILFSSMHRADARSR